jgi:hypothetical protein
LGRAGRKACSTARSSIGGAESFTRDRGEGAAVHEERADQNPVPGLGVQRAVADSVGADALDITVQTDEALCLRTAIDLVADEDDLVRRGGAQCALQRCIADAAGVFQGRRDRRQHGLIEQGGGEQTHEYRPGEPLESIADVTGRRHTVGGRWQLGRRMPYRTGHRWVSSARAPNLVH